MRATVIRAHIFAQAHLLYAFDNLFQLLLGSRHQASTSVAAVGARGRRRRGRVRSRLLDRLLLQQLRARRERRPEAALEGRYVVLLLPSRLVPMRTM